MPIFLIKRSMSPDGKIDSTSVEVSIDAELTDTQTVIDAIALTDNFANYVRQQPVAARVFAKAETPSGAPLAEGTVSGIPTAVFDGDVKPGGTKPGPGAIIIFGEKFKSFDKKFIALAKEGKSTGKPVVINFKRNEQWKSNDITSIAFA